jgi:hypothetical protein
MNPQEAVMNTDKIEEPKKISIVIEVDEDRNVKVYSSDSSVSVEVVKYDEIDSTEELVEKAKEIGKKAPHEVYTD